MYIFGNFTLTDPAIDFGLKVHPVCLPIASNSDPNVWTNQDVDILGFSTKDKGQSSNRGDILKTARMKVFNHTTCNNKLDKEKKKVKKCKSFLKEFKSLFLIMLACSPLTRHFFVRHTLLEMKNFRFQVYVAY